MKQRTCINIFIVIIILAIGISLLVYFLHHSKKHEVSPIDTLNTATTTNAAITISNGDDNDNSQLTTGFTAKTSSSNQFNNLTTSTSYAVKDSTFRMSTNTLITVSTKTVQNTVQSNFQTTNMDTTGQKITTTQTGKSVFIEGKY
ncbi:unnamed protein product [Adineta steineri]|uniref:Uncharacterized protein n=1 Tax=Adineta steineri TaxID=433720 RepID=A0A819M178_9BILA|nr:unnamed protein product [Adineta steineri]CAF3972279.1 unnamed protein product [Adineta steineri]